MFLIRINNQDLKYPQQPKDIKVSQFIDFMKSLGQCIYSEDMYANTINLANCLAEFWRISLDQLGEVESDNVDTKNYYLGLEEVKEFNSIAGLVSGISKVIERYVPSKQGDSLDFNYRDRTWTIPKFKASDFSDEFLRPVMKFGAVMRINEAKRLASLVVRKDKDGKDLDPNGSAQYTELLFIVASLAENKEFDPYLSNINERIEYFKDIDMQSALDVCFFLTNIQILSQGTKDLTSFLIHQN